METLDIIGWIATALVIFSFMINDMLRLRFVNLIEQPFGLHMELLIYQAR